MRHVEQQFDRRAAPKSKRLPPTQRIEDQGTGLQRHDHEGRQWDGDDVRGDAVEPGTVKVEQGERYQGDLDHEARGNHGGERANCPREYLHARAAAGGALPTGLNEARRSR